jgi:predicted amidophosphoribosyltransferase
MKQQSLFFWIVDKLLSKNKNVTKCESCGWWFDVCATSCPKCGAAHSGVAPQPCGEPQKATALYQKRWVWYILVGFILLLSAGLLEWFL